MEPSEGSMEDSIALVYGEGMVVLAGPHLVFEEESDQYSVTYLDQFEDRYSDWCLTLNATGWCLHEII